MTALKSEMMEMVELRNGEAAQATEASNRMLTLPTGLFYFLREPDPGAHGSTRHSNLRISLVQDNGTKAEISGFQTGGWLKADGDAALIRVYKGPAKVMITTYRRSGESDSPPRWKMKQLLGAIEKQLSVQSNDATLTQRPNCSASPPGDVLAHFEGVGDVRTNFGEWLGERRNGPGIEGFSISAPDGVDPSELLYQAVLGRDWFSPIVPAGTFCGSRGIALALLGLRIQLKGEAAKRYDIQYSANFFGGGSCGPVSNNEICQNKVLAPMCAFQVHLSLRKTGRKKSRQVGFSGS